MKQQDTLTVLLAVNDLSLNAKSLRQRAVALREEADFLERVATDIDDHASKIRDFFENAYERETA